MGRVTQITRGPGGRILTNTHVWSPDSRFIVFDTRSDPDGTLFDGTEIRIVDVETGAVETIYTSKNGACCGVATFHPTENRVVFILGPEFPTPDWEYGPAHRQGVIVDLAQPGIAINLDARDLTSPFTPGALRGGSHVHVYNPDGQCVSFTYNDAILSQFPEATPTNDVDQRNVGASYACLKASLTPCFGLALTPCPSPNSGRGESGGETASAKHKGWDSTSAGAKPQPLSCSDSPLPELGEGQGVRASPKQGVGCETEAWVDRNHPGTTFSVLVTRTTANPTPGSDEIQRAFEEGWVGREGYRKPDGTQQKRALAFLGEVIAPNGEPLIEVFIVDLPDDLTIPGDDGPLEGTETRRPLPPKGTQQRRLTFTADRTYPGVQGPRHWVRSSPDGTRIAFLMRDDAGLPQIWTVSPNGGAPRPVTRDTWAVASAFSWSPDGKQLAYVADNSVFVVEAESGVSRRLTPRSRDADAPLPLACVFSPEGKKIAYQRHVPENGSTDAARSNQIFVVTIADV